MAGQSADAGVVNVDDLKLADTLQLGLSDLFSNMGQATSSATSSAPVTWSTGSKQVMSGSSSASDTMSGLFKIGLTIAGLTALFYFLNNKKGR